jgi:radical SAM superfamily enzyme YgiQ (UPF0313 family)
VDLLILSGRLAERCEVHVLDAVADGLEEPECLAMIEKLAPHVILSMIGAVSYDEDRAFLAKLKTPTRRIVVSGDVVLDDTEEWLRQHAFVDAALLDFTGEDIIHFLENRNVPLQGLVSRHEARPALARKRSVNAEFTIPIPRHDLFTSPRYRYPFVKRKEFATVLTDYGCPYACSFCVMSTIGYKYRPVDNVMEELRFLKKLGTREIYFSDQTFGVNRMRTLELCARMKAERLDFGWVCFSRVDLLNEELLDAMQGAGCHTVMLGVESAHEEMLRKYRKGITKQQIREAFRLCKARRIRTVATFILGLPEETEDTAHETIRFARELGCDFASFNVAVPRMGTHLRRAAIGEGLISPDVMTMDQAGSTIVMSTRHLTRERLGEIRIKAMRRFYLSPGFLWRRISGITTFYELKEQLSEGWALLGTRGRYGKNNG